MPSPKNATRTLAEVREECRLFGVQPGRSIAESEARIAAEKRVRNARDEAAACDRLIAKRQDEDAFEARLAAIGDAVTHGTGIVQVVTPGDERHVKFAEFAKAAVAEAPENITPEEEAAMRDYSAEQRRMDAMGEAAWQAEQFKPRMSRMMRMLADTTAICGTLARNPLIYGGDMPRYAFAHTDGWPAVVRYHLHLARLAKQNGTGRHVPNRVPMQQMWR